MNVRKTGKAGEALIEGYHGVTYSRFINGSVARLVEQSAAS